MIGRVFNSIFTNKTTDWAQTDKGPVQVEREMAPGEVARGILAAAITGMAAGYSPSLRGKGAGTAASAGFTAVEGQKEQVEEKKAAQAQQTFKNVGESEERQIRAAENIRAQLRSVELSQASQDAHTKAVADYTKGQYDQSRKLDQDREADLMTYNNYINRGAKVIMVNGKPAEYPDLNHAEEARTNGGHDDIMDAPNFQTRSVYNPTTHMYEIMRVPNDDNTPQWLGVKVDAHGKPELDKDGKMVPDGKYLDENLKPVAPSGMTTPKQLFDHNETVKKDLLQQKDIQSQIDYRKVEGVAKMRAEREQGQNDTAMQHLNAADGDVDKINPKTGKPFVTPSDRIVLQKQLVSQMTLESNIQKANLAALNTLDPKTQPDEVAQAEALVKSSTENLNNYQNMLINIHHGAGTTEMNVTPQVYDQAIAVARTMPADKAIAFIKAAPNFNEATKTRLIKDIQSGKGAMPAVAPEENSVTTSAPDPSTVSTNLKIVTDNKGRFATVAADGGVPPGWTTLSMGTKAPEEVKASAETEQPESTVVK